MGRMASVRTRSGGIVNVRGCKFEPIRVSGAWCTEARVVM